MSQIDFKDLLLVLIGGLAGVLLQNILYPQLSAKFDRWRLRARNRRINHHWERFEGLYPKLHLQQAGWSEDGSFDPQSVQLELVGNYELPSDIQKTIREKHVASWISGGATDDQKVGACALSISRISDDPRHEREGKSHRIHFSAHTYKYFDFLATHRRLAVGDPEELAVLQPLVDKSHPYEPIPGFPNPLSVGLSLFCEGGNVLVIAVRTRKTEGGGDWHGGKRFNAVGENTNPSDFVVGHGGKMLLSPYAVARRGLYEEMGFDIEHALRLDVRLHSLAWASDIRDHKFFGYAVSSLAEAEIRRQWEHAPDRQENQQLVFHQVETPQQAERLWASIVAEAGYWAPEALFCTARSLLLRGHLNPSRLLAER